MDLAIDSEPANHSKGQSVTQEVPLPGASHNTMTTEAKQTSGAASPPQRLREREQLRLPGFVPEVVPEGHKLIHIMRHGRAWHK